MIGQVKTTLINNNNLGDKRMFSDTLNPSPNNDNMIYSYQPYLSLQGNEHMNRPRLSHKNTQIAQSQTQKNL
jgi:hypothetical protein